MNLLIRRIILAILVMGRLFTGSPRGVKVYLFNRWIMPGSYAPVLGVFFRQTKHVMFMGGIRLDVDLVISGAIYSHYAQSEINVR